MTDTQASFVPHDGAIELRFVKGNDGFAPIPELVAAGGFNHRFAVIQDTGVAGCADMYFDEQLWRCLLEFVAVYGSDQMVIDPFGQGKADIVSLDDFLLLWDGSDDEYKTPPWAILASHDGAPTLGMVTEYWERVGGEWPYADSYTYSIYSDVDLEHDIIAHLRAARCAERWSLTLPAAEVPPSKVRMPPVSPNKVSRLLLKLARRFKA